MQITALTQTIKDSERVSIFVDGEFALAVDKSTLISQHLTIGREVSESYLAQLKDIDVYNLITRKVINWMASRPHSSREIKTKVAEIIKKRQDRSLNLDIDVTDLTEYVVYKLAGIGFDDRSFARFWIEGRRDQAKYGKQKVMAELSAKGVDRATAIELIEEYFPDDKQNALILLQAKFGVDSVSQIKDTKEKARAYRYLASRGFRPV